MSDFPSIQQWSYLHGCPESSAVLKSQPDDFQVDEALPYELSGEGEHLHLRIQKTGLNTGYLAQQIAKFYNVRELDVSYAGRKDKNAVTTQWFSVWLPGHVNKDVSEFQHDDCLVLEQSWHSKKLRRGSVKSNHFKITLRETVFGDDFQSRMELIQTNGVPNYFGPQRFGNINQNGIPGNLALASYLLKGDAIRKREKRSMAISALRAWLFNEYVSQRIKSGPLQPQPGDAMSLAGSNSYFIADEIDDDILNRFADRDIQVTAPLWGEGSVPTRHQVAILESKIAAQHQEICSTLEGLGLQQERRKVLLFPDDLQWYAEGQSLTLKFSLPAGCFATSVIRELVTLVQDIQ